MTMWEIGTLNELFKRGSYTGVCISRPSALCLAPGPDPQFVFTVPGPQFVFTVPGPQFVFTVPGPQFVFTGPGPKFVFTGPGPKICIYRLWTTILLLVQGLGFAYTVLVSSICICFYDPLL